jgi:hypothetical protein
MGAISMRAMGRPITQLLSVKWEKCEDLPPESDAGQKSDGKSDGGEGVGTSSKQQQGGPSKPDVAGAGSGSRGLARFVPPGLSSMLQGLRGAGANSR